MEGKIAFKVLCNCVSTFWSGSVKLQNLQPCKLWNIYNVPLTAFYFITLNLHPLSFVLNVRENNAQ